MKFNLNDFMQLDVKGLLAVNGGGYCSGASNGTTVYPNPYYGGGSSSPSGGGGGGAAGKANTGASCSTINLGKYMKQNTVDRTERKDGTTVVTERDPSGKIVKISYYDTKTGKQIGQDQEVSGYKDKTDTGTEVKPNPTEVNSGNPDESDSAYNQGLEWAKSTGGGGSNPSNVGGGTCGNYDNKTAFEKILNEVYKKKNNSIEADDPGEMTGCYKKGYQCDEYVAEILKNAGFDTKSYNVDDPSGKEVNDHINDLINSNKTFETDASKLITGVYVVFMSDDQDVVDSHAALLFVNNDGSAFMYDNSSRNFKVGDNSYLGGIERTGWKGSSAVDICNQYPSYESFYFQKVN